MLAASLLAMPPRAALYVARWPSEAVTGRRHVPARASTADDTLNAPARASTADDTLTLEGATSLFPPTQSQQECDAKLRTRLSGLALARSRVAPSAIDGAGMGLHASRAIFAGELVTLYPGDAVVMWESSEATDGLGTDCFFDVGGEPDSEWRMGWAAQRPDFVARAWEYGARISAVRAIIGDPSATADAAYLGHLANDAAMCLRPGMAALAYAIASEAGANVGVDPLGADGCQHLALVATEDIPAGAEILLSYGADYWLSRLPDKPELYTLDDSSTYYGEVASGRIHGQGEYKDAGGNRYVGEFVDNQFDGVGIYFKSDGSAEVGRYVAGKSVGISVGWNADRTEAYRLVTLGTDGGVQRQEVSLEAAKELAEGLGAPVPPGR